MISICFSSSVFQVFAYLLAALNFLHKLLARLRSSTDFIDRFAFTRETDYEIPSKGTSPFTPMGEITVDPKGVLKLLNGLKAHKAPGPDGLSAREFLKLLQSWLLSTMSRLLRELYQMIGDRQTWPRCIRTVRNMTQLITDRCR